MVEELMHQVLVCLTVLPNDVESALLGTLRSQVSAIGIEDRILPTNRRHEVGQHAIGVLHRDVDAADTRLSARGLGLEGIHGAYPGERAVGEGVVLLPNRHIVGFGTAVEYHLEND